MNRIVEMRRLQKLPDRFEGLVADQQSSKQGLFGLDIVRRQRRRGDRVLASYGGAQGRDVGGVLGQAASLSWDSIMSLIRITMSDWKAKASRKNRGVQPR